MSNTEFNTGVKGAGNWAPGTTVREIEGHFHKENEPQGAAPISEDGGVPNVDYSTKDRIKDAVTGHSHGSSSTGSGLTGSHGSSTGSGLTGSGAVGTGSSGLSGNHPGTSDGATHGISDVASRDLKEHSSSSSTGLGATGHTGQQGHGLGTTTATGTAAPDSRVGDSSNSGSLADKAKSAVSGSTNSSGRTDADTNTASGTGSSGLSGNHPGTSDGATHGISDVASRDLKEQSSSTTGLGATGHSGQQGHGLGTTTATGTAAPDSRVGDSSNSGSLADKAKSAVSGSTNSSGRTDADTNTASGKAQQVGQQGFNKATGADGAHSHAPEEKFGAGGHHGSTDSPTGVHGSTAPHKEGVFEKIKHAISGDKK